MPFVHLEFASKRDLRSRCQNLKHRVLSLHGEQDEHHLVARLAWKMDRGFEMIRATVEQSHVQSARIFFVNVEVTSHFTLNFLVELPAPSYTDNVALDLAWMAKEIETGRRSLVSQQQVIKNHTTLHVQGTNLDNDIVTYLGELSFLLLHTTRMYDTPNSTILEKQLDGVDETLSSNGLVSELPRNAALTFTTSTDGSSIPSTCTNSRNSGEMDAVPSRKPCLDTANDESNEVVPSSTRQDKTFVASTRHYDEPDLGKSVERSQPSAAFIFLESVLGMQSLHPTLLIAFAPTVRSLMDYMTSLQPFCDPLRYELSGAKSWNGDWTGRLLDTGRIHGKLHWYRVVAISIECYVPIRAAMPLYELEDMSTDFLSRTSSLSTPSLSSSRPGS